MLDFLAKREKAKTGVTGKAFLSGNGLSLFNPLTIN